VSEFTINSTTNQTVSSLKRLFVFLSDFKNFAAILPEDKVQDFKYEGDQCSFNIKGITPMTVKIKEQTPYSKILFSTEGLAKFNFSLLVSFIGDANQTGSCSVELNGNLNPFIKKMAEKPLASLVNTMSEKLAKLKLES
jgi:carbon monoxide dehydrogenase subunit G